MAQLSDAAIKFLYKDYGFPTPDVTWVRKNLPTDENGLRAVLQKQKITIAAPTNVPKTASTVTEKQKLKLDAAVEKVNKGTANAKDKENIAYATKNLGYTPPINTAPEEAQSKKTGEFYRIGGDIYEAGTNRKIGATE